MLLFSHRALPLPIILLLGRNNYVIFKAFESYQPIPPIVVPMAMQPYSVDILVGSEEIPYNALLDSLAQAPQIYRQLTLPPMAV